MFSWINQAFTSSQQASERLVSNAPFLILLELMHQPLLFWIDGNCLEDIMQGWTLQSYLADLDRFIFQINQFSKCSTEPDELKHLKLTFRNISIVSK